MNLAELIGASLAELLATERELSPMPGPDARRALRVVQAIRAYYYPSARNRPLTRRQLCGQGNGDLAGPLG